ncbi:hypothetical protein QFZ82_001693 [Streptomyces sp. V4I23]|uniref:DUF6336 family protein n=1 Tax=Streptomyces sp. V4I23 TaxID=3042282 RepID=UPI00277FA8EB|nr:DUF6336 family protein [Streptomyces sp. V4I23]MDQ1007208.1 hypothetical protein [Streptomyces sp. V4I23]
MTRTLRPGPEPTPAPTTDEDGVRLPRLRFKDVVVRGAVQGIAAVVLLAVVSLFVPDHHDRETFLAVVAGFAMVGSGVCIVFGGFFWAVCGGDVRRWCDWRTITGQTEAVTVMGPALFRLGVLALVLFPGAFGLYEVVDNAPYDSWMYGA